MSMTPEAKRALSTTIRTLRSQLLEDLHDAVESTYRLSVPTRSAGLGEAARVRRGRLEGWITEQLKLQGGAARGKATRGGEELRREAEKQAAYTLLNRLVLLRLMEAPGPSGEPLRAPALVTGGWESRAYAHFRELAPGLVRGDETEGYAFLLQLVFEDLAVELPGLYGPAGVAELIPVPAATLRRVVDALDAPALVSCWTDDMTLGWVYQYWNDPEREGLDAKLNAGGKVEPHEIASKTQMFTERYMVDWLLQNTLGPLWLGVCRRHGWVAEVQARGVLASLEERRARWRERRRQGEVPLTELMPLYTEEERRWASYVPQPLPTDGAEGALESMRDLKLLDPAVGSGHFLVVALDLLVALYREEARHRGEEGQERWSDRAVVEHILSHNLHGIDLDPRAAQIAAAALWLKAQQLAPGARPQRLNLVASNLKLGALPSQDEDLQVLLRQVEQETGIASALTRQLVEALRDADHLGSLLKVDKALEEALSAHEERLRKEATQGVAADQGDLYTGFKERSAARAARANARATLLERLEEFLAKHTGGEDLGLRLQGEQLAAGVRFVRMVREGSYDLVVANPPYQGTSKMARTGYVEQHYRRGKADLYAAFLLRGLELVKEGGVSAMLTMRNWMFIKQYAELREHLLATHGLRALGDFDRGAFEDVPDEVVSVAVSVFARGTRASESVALCPTPRDDRSRDGERTQRKRAATRCHEGRHTFDPAALKVVPEWPLVYWWDEGTLTRFTTHPLLQALSEVRQGLCTGNNARFLRSPHEVHFTKPDAATGRSAGRWFPFLKGGESRQWVEPLVWICDWQRNGLTSKVGNESGHLASRPQNEAFYLVPGVAVQTTGNSFAARIHRHASIFGDKARSVFCEDLDAVTVCLNSSATRNLAQDLNPTIDFTVGDLKRLPFVGDPLSPQVMLRLKAAFGVHEAHREPSVEFRCPGPSPWRGVQAWAQLAVDRPEGAPLPPYVEELDPEPPTAPLSFALGVALGRFGAPGSGQEGILDPATADLSGALPHGILFLDLTLDDRDLRDGLGHPACSPLIQAWATHGPSVGGRRGLREWLALDFFKDVHRPMYDNRPIHWPLSSPHKTFVAWVTLHRMGDQTLHILLADHLVPTLLRLDGELADLRKARDGADKKAARAAERHYDRTLKARGELATFIRDVEACADEGAPPTDARCPKRERDARYAHDLDDGVMIGSAGLWPLLDPQWRDPRKWWKELAEATGRKDYDWAHLAMRYWPTRVDTKCKADPSLAVAHGCFWRYHPGRAWAWELRLQDEIGPTFRITEPPYCPGGADLGDGGDAPHRAAFLRDQPEAALAAVVKEALRRRGRGGKRRPVTEIHLLEAGLWAAHPALVWASELALIEAQGVDCHILSPDEAPSRAAFVAEHPDRVRARAALLVEVATKPGLFADPEEEAPEESENDGDTDAEEDTP